MSEKPEYTSEELMDKVVVIMQALTADGTIKASVSLDALAFVAATIYDLDPTLTAVSHMRKAGEQQGSSVATYIKFLRDHLARTGTHFAEAIGGTVQVDPAALAALGKGATRQ